MKIEIHPTSYYSRGDERRFFQGLSDIDCISNVKGVGRSLLFDVDLRQLNREKILEIIALLWRYHIDLKPLRPLVDNNKKFAWVSEPHFYWHSNMYSENLSARDHI